MNILDENIIESQRQLLRTWRIPHRQIGQDIGQKGMKDQEQIIPLLQSLVGPVLFTRDMGFYNWRLCHQKYCIACLAVAANEVAVFIRRFLRHSQFDAKAKRMGKVVRLSQTGISFWRLNFQKEERLVWRE
jgi:hypothetical protein